MLNRQFWQDENFRRLVVKTNGMLAELEAVYQDFEEMDYNDNDPGHNFEVRNECGTESPQYDSKQMQAALEYIMQESILLARAAYNTTFYEHKAQQEVQ